MNKQQLSSTLRVTAVLVSVGFAAAALPAHAAKGIAVSQTSVKVSESGVKGYYDVALTEKPSADVTVFLEAPDGQVTAVKAGTTAEISLKFTADNFAQAQKVAVSAVNDRTPEGAHEAFISHRSASPDPGYNEPSQTPVMVKAEITDDEKGDVYVMPSDATTVVKEGGIRDSYDLVLSRQPSANVTITVTPDRMRVGLPAQVTISPVSVVFTPKNYLQPQTITISAEDDKLAEAPPKDNCDTPQDACETLRHQVSSDDSAYNTFPIDAVTVSIEDNDIPGVTAKQSNDSTRVIEGGATDSYSLTLDTRPSTEVTVTMNAGSQLTLTPPSVTFTSDNYSTAQPIMVSAVDDSSAEGPQDVTISHTVSSGDLAYKDVPASPAVTVHISDNDVYAVLVSESGGVTRVTEGAQQGDSYTLVLTKRPTSDVTVDINPGSQIKVSSAQATFNAANYATPQTITVTAVDDLVVEDSQKGSVLHTISTDDFGYQNVAVDAISAEIADNDIRGVLLSESGGSTQVTEGAVEGDIYSIALSAQPLSDVTITLSADPQLSVSPVSLTFTPENFMELQAVTVISVDDAVANSQRMATITHTVSTDDEGYKPVQVSAVSVTITDDDVANVLVEPSSGSVAESSNEAPFAYTLRLATQPVADVTVIINPESQLSVTPQSVTFTRDNYAAAQTVEVSAVDDRVAQGLRMTTITHTVSTDDEGYKPVQASAVSVTIDDDDVAAVLIEGPNPSTGVAETSGSTQYTVRLTSQPLADVTIVVDPGSQLQANPSTLTFTPGNYDTPQTVTLNAVDDAEVEGDHTGTVTHQASSGDRTYEGIVVSELTVDIADNDVAPQAGSSGNGGGSLSWLTLAGLLALSRLRRKLIIG